MKVPNTINSDQTWSELRVPSSHFWVIIISKPSMYERKRIRGIRENEKLHFFWLPFNIPLSARKPSACYWHPRRDMPLRTCGPRLAWGEFFLLVLAYFFVNKLQRLHQYHRLMIRALVLSSSLLMFFLRNLCTGWRMHGLSFLLSLRKNFFCPIVLLHQIGRMHIYYFPCLLIIWYGMLYTHAWHHCSARQLLSHTTEQQRTDHSLIIRVFLPSFGLCVH